MEFYRNESSNLTDVLKKYDSSVVPEFAYFSIIVSLWTIVSNLFILICFIKHQHIINGNSFTFQVLTLIVGDVLAGFSSIPVFVTAFDLEIRFELCAFQYVAFLSTQNLLLFHILGICVNRLIIVNHAAKQVKTTCRRKLIIVYLCIIWILIVLIFTLPFFIWIKKYERTITECSMNELFQDNYKAVVIYYVSFFVVPFILTNVVYVTIILKIRYSVQITPPPSRSELEENELISHTPKQINSPKGDFPRPGQRSASLYTQKLSISLKRFSSLNKRTESSHNINAVKANVTKENRRNESIQNKDSIEAVAVSNHEVSKPNTPIKISNSMAADETCSAESKLHKLSHPRHEMKPLASYSGMSFTEFIKENLEQNTLSCNKISKYTQTEKKKLLPPYSIDERKEQVYRNNISCCMKTNDSDPEITNPPENRCFIRRTSFPTFRNQKKALTVIGKFVFSKNHYFLLFINSLNIQLNTQK